MKRNQFPYIAFALGSVLFLVVLFGSQPHGDAHVLPLLTLLIVSEFAFIVTAIGVYTGFKYRAEMTNKMLYTIVTILCLFLSVRFLLTGIALFPSLS
jgi:hypothetical protein